MKTQTMYRCEQHGLLLRMQTHLGFSEPVGGRLECALCERKPPLPVFVEPVEVVPLSEVREALLGEEAVEAAAETPQVDDGYEDARRIISAAFDAAFPSDSEGQG